jgi:hypothetical protein
MIKAHTYSLHFWGGFPLVSQVALSKPHILVSWAAITDDHKQGDLKTEIYSVTIQKARSLKSRCNLGWFFLGAPR